MDIVLLGTGTPLPDPDRAGPASLIRNGKRNILVDCGRGVLMRLAGTGIRNPRLLEAVFITHLHSDHTCDFNEVLTMWWAAGADDVPLKVVGPVGTRDWVDRTIAMMSDDIRFRMDHHADLNWRPRCDVTEVGDGTAYDVDGLRVTSALEDHGPVKPALGFRFEVGGAAAVIAGDTKPCPGLDGLCAGADAYVQTVLRPEVVKAVAKAMSLKRLEDILDYHSSLSDAAQTAKRAGVGTLVLTHMLPFCPRENESEWVDQAGAEFGGKVVIGPDLTSITI
ncbi:MAG: MBL fold metallo-hydrolase [Actinomycetota bacterium]